MIQTNQRVILCWGTRTRTRKDRTRICSVANYTIPQSRDLQDALSKTMQKYALSLEQPNNSAFFSREILFCRAHCTFSPCVMCLPSALAVHFTSGAAIEVGQAATQLTRQSTTPSPFVLNRRARSLFSFPKSKTATAPASDVVAVLKVNCPCGRK